MIFSFVPILVSISLSNHIPEQNWDTKISFSGQRKCHLLSQNDVDIRFYLLPNIIALTSNLSSTLLVN